MFRRLQWKIVFIFVALVMAIMLVIGVYMYGSIINMYCNNFSRQMGKVMSGEFPSTISSVLGENIEKNEKVSRINNVISAYSGQLGLSDQRQCAVLYAKDASRIDAADSGKISPEKTPNILQAMAGKTGSRIRLGADYMDYAHFINGMGGENYIIYIKDNRQEINDVIERMLYIIVQSLLFGILASILLGYFLSKTITNPISVLTEKAEDFAEGNFESNLEVLSKDEIGTLVETFNYMGGVMKTAINEVAGEKHKLEIVLEHINNGIIAFNTEQEVILINSAAKNILKIEDLSKISFDSFFKDLNANVCMAEFMYLKKFKTDAREIEINNKHIKAYFVPFKYEDDIIAGVVCVFSDITEQFNLDRSRKKFVAEVSHELKTPLTTIGTYTETLIDSHPADKEMTLSFLQTIHNETIKMTNLVKNLLTLSKFDSQSVEMNKEFFDLGAMVKEIVSTFRVETENKNLSVLYNVVNEIPPVYADAFQIERAVKNIISNAIKYTPQSGDVKVFVGCLYNEAYIKIEDNGIGIPDSDLPHIFERFYRVDKARSREQGGTGLGLAIAKEIIENHGGSIGMESKVGEYTRVTIKLPINGAA